MREAVSDILVDRRRMADGLSRMVTYSFIAHVALLSVLYFLPARWFVPQMEMNVQVMTIELGGTPGPVTGGMTSISTSPVQQVAPPKARPAPQPTPAAPAPEMVLPSPTTRPAPKPPAKPIEKPQDKAASRKPTTGSEIRSGSAKYETGGAPTPFGGLTTGGGGAGGATVDVQNFCCPAYLITMTQMVRANWNQNQGATGEVQMKFTILRDGTIVNADVETSSGLFNLDQEARRALAKTRKLPPLPREFTEPTLPVHIVFRYQR